MIMNICDECFSHNLELENKYLEYDEGAKKELIHEVYRCKDCGNLQTTKILG